MRARTTLVAVLVVVIATACGGDEATDPTTSTASAETTTTTIAASTTTAPDTDTAVVTTTSGSDDADDSTELPDTLKQGTYLVGTEIRVGSWEPDECGCIWAWVAADGTETPGTSEDARVSDSDHAVKLGPCTWSFSG